MITLDKVSKIYKTRQGPRKVLDNISMTVAKGEKVGVLGRNGAGKSTFIRLVSGAEQPSEGEIRRGISISWPLAFGGAFQGSLSGIDNLKFICRVYGVPIPPAIDFVERFSELGDYLKEPVRKYSSGMRARLAFAISMAIDFDCFLIDEVVAVGDSRFHEKCHEELFVKRSDRAMIIVSHDSGYIREHCERAAVLINGQMNMFSNVSEGIDFYQKSIC